MNQVFLRLARRFDEVPIEIVEAVVRTAHASMTGPIRDYVPILVERQATDRLREYADLLTPLDQRLDVSGTGAALSAPIPGAGGFFWGRPRWLRHRPRPPWAMALAT